MRLLGGWAAALALVSLSCAHAQEMSPEYLRNYQAQDSSLDRVATAGKYTPTEVVHGAPGTPLPVAAPGERVIADSALQAAQAQADRSHTMALLVYAHGKIELQSYAPGFSPASFFDSYSSHKGLLALAILIAADRHFLSLDDPAARYIPAWRSDARRQITLRDLLWMQSGLTMLKFEVKPYNPVLDMFVGLDVRSPVDKAAWSLPPGQKFEFNHLNAQALYQSLVAATHMRYAAFLSRYLWQPLGETDSYVALDHPGGDARAVCCFINTAPNWLRLGVMLAHGGVIDRHRILSERYVRMLSAPTAINPAFGMNVQRANCAAQSGPNTGYAACDLYYFEGHGGQRLYIVPSHDLVVYRTGRVDYNWDDVTFANTLLKGMP